jgi:hypothetical protein
MKNSLTTAWNSSLFQNFVLNDTMILLEIENNYFNPSSSKNK